MADMLRMERNKAVGRGGWEDEADMEKSPRSKIQDGGLNGQRESQGVCLTYRVISVTREVFDHGRTQDEALNQTDGEFAYAAGR